jgi:hypothetical protein
MVEVVRRCSVEGTVVQGRDYWDGRQSSIDDKFWARLEWLGGLWHLWHRPTT